MFQRLLAQIAERLDRAGLRYMVIGGQAVLAYGEPRLTRDIDIAIDIRWTQIDRLLEAVADLDLEYPDDPRAFARDTDVVPCRQRSSGVRIDLVLADSEFEHEALSRVRLHHMGSHAVRFVSPEDLVVLKLLAGRPRDLEDARGIVLKHPSLDLELIRNWLARYEPALGRKLVAPFDTLVREARAP